MKLKGILAGILTMFAWTSLAGLLTADTALVRTITNLRNDPTAHHPPLRILLPGDELTILDASKPQYLMVKTDDKLQGWVWKNAVEVLPDPGSAPVPRALTTPPDGGGVSPDWPKPNPVDTDLITSEGTCSGTGDGGDTATNARKNRSDPPPAPNDVTWSGIATLPYPPAPASRSDWTAEQLAIINPYEGSVVRTVGFLTHLSAVEDTGSGESTNCHFHAPDDVDWHIYLQESTGAGIDKAVIVETTPRIRKLHNWAATVLDKNVGTGNPIRVTGFLMVDPEHRNQVGKYRATVWEIHPITNIEVCNTNSCADADWIPLDRAK